MQATSQSIIQRIEAAGWRVSVHRVNGKIEMHAVKLLEGEPVHVVRCDDGDGPSEELQAAKMLDGVLNK